MVTMNTAPFDTQKVIDTILLSLNGSESKFMDNDKMQMFLWFASLEYSHDNKVSLLKEQFMVTDDGPRLDPTHLCFNHSNVYETVSNSGVGDLIEGLKFPILYTPNENLVTVTKLRGSAWYKAKKRNKTLIDHKDMVNDNSYQNSLRYDFADVTFFDEG